MNGFGSPFDWDDDEAMQPWEDELYGADEDYFTFFDPLSGSFTVVERINQYVQDPEVTRREIEAVQAYMDNGFEDLGAYLARHNEFTTYLQEREAQA